MAEKEKNRPTLSEPKTKAAREARRNFDRRVEEQLKKEEQIAFNILVWGMSPDQNTPIARKREDIGHQLIEDGHNAMFSEDLADFDREPSRSETGKEFAQAKSADFIIVFIEGSPGALAEVCDFCVRPDVASKVYVMAPESYRGGYAGQGALRELDEGYGSVHWYQEGDIVDCNVLTRACQRVQARRSMAHRHRSGRPE